MKKKLEENVKQKIIESYVRGDPLTEILDTFSISDRTVTNVLRAVGIARNRSRVKYDYDLLVSLYLSGMSSREVAKLTGASSTVVSHVTKLAGVSREKRIRNSVLEQRGRRCPEISEESRSFLDGLLISDGCLGKPSKYTPTSGYYHCSTCYEWLLKIQEYLSSIEIGSTIKPVTRRDGQFELRTYRYDQLYHLYQRWYPNGGHKRVPHDIDLANKELLRNWIYGDGTRGRTELRFCTDSFPLDDIDFIVKKLNSLGFNFVKRRYGKCKNGDIKYRIVISKTRGFADFMNYVGPPDISGFAYKWRM